MRITQEQFEEIVGNFQETNFGREYRGASLSKLSYYSPEFAESIIREFAFSEPRMGTVASKEFRGAIFCGPPGTGKTYLLAALVPWALLNFKTVRFWSEYSLSNKLLQFIEEGKAASSHLNDMIDDELLMYDDFGAKRTTPFMLDCANQILYDRDRIGMTTLISTNLTEKEVEGVYGNRLESRAFRKGMKVFNFWNYPDLRKLIP